MPVEIFSPERLVLARQRRGLFAQELAAQLEVTPKTVGRWERGEKEPTPENVDGLARVLAFPREFFFGDAPPTLDAAAFRALSKMTARQRSMALAAGQQAISLDMLIAEQFKRPAPNIPDLRELTPENAAEALRADWGLGYRPIPNFVHLLEKQGVRVYSLVHGGGEIDGFCTWQGETPFIFLNMTKTAERSRMDAAHEVSHLCLHAHAKAPLSKAEEDEAKVFASCFLMPAASFVASAPRRVNLPTIIEAKRRWGVSALAYVYRLNSLGLITEWQYKSLNIQIRSGYGATEPGSSLSREASQVLAKVFTSGATGTSRKDVARRLRIRLEDLDQMTFGLALTPVAGSIQPTASSPPSFKRPGIQLME